MANNTMANKSLSQVNATMMTAYRNSKCGKSPDLLNHSDNGLMGTRTYSRALDSTHETIKSSMNNTKRTYQTNSTNNLSASFNTIEHYGGNSKSSKASFMRATKSSRSKFTVR